MADFSIEQQKAMALAAARQRAAQAGGGGAPPAAAPPSVLQDVAQSAPTGLYHGVTGLATLPGNIDDTAMHIGHWLAEKIAGKPLPMPGRLGEGILPTAPQLEQRLGQDIPALAKLPEAQTGVGKFTEGVASFVPGALAMPAKSVGEVAINLMKYAVTPETVGKTAQTGAALVGASPETQAVAEGVGQMVGSGRGILKDRPAPEAMKLPEVKAAVSDFYTAADQKGIVVHPDAYNKLVNDVGQIKLSAERHPGSASLVDDISKMNGSAPDLEEIDWLRQQANDVLVDGSKGDARIARQIKTKIDGFVNGLQQNDLMAGDMTGVPELLQQGRALRVQQSRMEIIGRAMKTAENSAVGQSGDMDRALSNEFRKIANKDYLMSQFTPEQQAAIQEVVNKSRTERVGAFLEQFANPRSPRTGLIGMGLGGAASTMMGLGPAIGAAAVPAIGMAGRAIAQGVTERQAKLAADLAAGGGIRPPWRAARRLPIAASNTLGNMATMPPPGR